MKWKGAGQGQVESLALVVTLPKKSDKNSSKTVVKKYDKECKLGK